MTADVGRSMRAMLFEGVGSPLRLAEVAVPEPGPGQLLLRVLACGVCRTDLHLLDGEVEIAQPPRVLGHQIVARVEPDGRRVGVPWLGWTCGECAYCRSGRENLCPRARFTGRDIDGGFAEYAVADERFCFPIPDGFPDDQAAPLLCAGLIGYRCLRMCGDARRLGLYGFGAAAHILVQVARAQDREVYAFTREATTSHRRSPASSARRGPAPRAPHHRSRSTPRSSSPPTAALVPLALRAVAPGGSVVCGGIHMSDIPSFPYSDLWEERELRSVANLTRRDGEEFLRLAPEVPVHTRVRTYPLERANEALDDLRAGRFSGAAVVVP